MESDTYVQEVSNLCRLDERIKQYDQYITQTANEDAQSRQLMQLSGIGPTTASAIVATVGKGHDFTCADNGPPGLRLHYHPNYYGAFVIDPDGHNIEAVCHEAE